MSVDTSRAHVEHMAATLPECQAFAPRLYRAADTLRALLAERDALIHDIERAKESESALLAERDAARAEGYRRGLEIAATTAEQRDPEKPSSFLHRREQIAEAIRALPLTDAG